MRGVDTAALLLYWTWTDSTKKQYFSDFLFPEDLPFLKTLSSLQLVLRCVAAIEVPPFMTLLKIVYFPDLMRLLLASELVWNKVLASRDLGQCCNIIFIHKHTVNLRKSVLFVRFYDVFVDSRVSSFKIVNLSCFSFHLNAYTCTCFNMELIYDKVLLFIVTRRRRRRL